MPASHPISLLVAALVTLRSPCSRSKATAQLLLERAAEHNELSVLEREACRRLADELDLERHAPEARVARTASLEDARTQPPRRPRQIHARLSLAPRR